MTYDRPCSSFGSSQEDDEDEESCDPFEWDYEEAKEMWDDFFPKCGLLEEQIERVKATLLEQA
jgi:hypothetical protein